MKNISQAILIALKRRIYPKFHPVSFRLID